MKSAHSKLIGIVLLAITFAACGKTVTNNVPGPNNSTSQAPTAPSTGAQAESGGVINGGGGKGVRCMKDGKETVEVLDLYEAKSLYNLSLIDFGSSEEAAKNKLASILARHFWNPYTIQMDKFAEFLKQKYIQEFLDHVRFIDAGKKLRLTNDSYEPTLESGCEPVQIATYYDESVLLVDKALWSKLDWTNKMGLLAHEALYFFVRQNGSTNSMGTRKLVGMMFSTKEPRPMADGVPTDKKKFLECRISAGGFSKGNFFMYRSESPDGHKGLEIVFNGLGSSGSLFRTSSFLSDLSFFQLQLPKYAKTHEAELVKDTYPTRDRISLGFKGISEGQLKADLRILRGAGASVADTLDVACEVPLKFDELESQTTEAGEYSINQPSGSVDFLRVNSNGSLTLEETRQVGGPGGFSKGGLVPYPTVCRYKQLGMITKQDEKEIEYLVVSAELGVLDGLTDTDHCTDFMEGLNRKLADGSLRYTIRKSEFTKTK